MWLSLVRPRTWLGFPLGNQLCFDDRRSGPLRITKDISVGAELFSGPVRSNPTKGDQVMLGWILTFLVIALVAGALGFGGVAGASAGIAQVLFYVFLVLLLISLVMHFTRGVTR
jgi:uncharacterized membrane protein YtjA (UPF0391 family)